MRLKMDGENAVLVSDGGATLPVIVYDDGTEAPLNFPKLISDAKTRAEEREEWKRKYEESNRTLESFKSHLNGDEPGEWFKKATKALDTVKGLSDGQLLTVEKLEQIKKEEEQRWKSSLEEVERKSEEDKKRLQGEIEGLVEKDRNARLANLFSSSTFIKDKLRYAPDLMHARFGQYFVDSEDGSGFVPKDENGKTIYSKKDPSAPHADPDEALAYHIDRRPDRENFYRGSGASGTGAPSASTGSAGGTKEITRTDFLKREAPQQQKLLDDGWTVTD